MQEDLQAASKESRTHAGRMFPDFERCPQIYTEMRSKPQEPTSTRPQKQCGVQEKGNEDSIAREVPFLPNLKQHAGMHANQGKT